MKKLLLLSLLVMLTGCVTYIDEDDSTDDEMSTKSDPVEEVDNTMLSYIDENNPFNSTNYTVDVESTLEVDGKNIQDLTFTDQFDYTNQTSKLEGELNDTPFTGYIDYQTNMIYVKYGQIVTEVYQDSSFKLAVIDADSLTFLDTLGTTREVIDESSYLYTYTINITENEQLEYYMPLKINVLDELYKSSELGAELDYLNIEYKVLVADGKIASLEISFEAEMNSDTSHLKTTGKSTLVAGGEFEIVIPEEYLNN